MVTKKVAIARLVGEGYVVAAVTLDHWSSQKATDQGWDGWFQRAFPHLVEVVWRDGEVCARIPLPGRG